jgi:SAM-dependent methyltransferase
MARDPYAATDQLDNVLLEAIVARLESRGKHPTFDRMLHDYVSAMAIDDTKTVLDLGCGTGVAARAIARRPDFSGRVTGIDLSSALTDAAMALATDEGLAGKVEFRPGDTSKLDVPDASFDAVIGHTLLSHVGDPLAVIREAARVTRAGGMLGFFDGDFASLTFGNADTEAGRAYDDAVIRAIITNPRVMRQMPRLLRASGLELVAFRAYVNAEAGTAEYWLPAIESFRKLVPQEGGLSASEVEAWADSLMLDSARGDFFGASNYYAYVARRP